MSSCCLAATVIGAAGAGQFPFCGQQHDIAGRVTGDGGPAGVQHPQHPGVGVLGVRPAAASGDTVAVWSGLAGRAPAKASAGAERQA